MAGSYKKKYEMTDYELYEFFISEAKRYYEARKMYFRYKRQKEKLAESLWGIVETEIDKQSHTLSYKRIYEEFAGLFHDVMWQEYFNLWDVAGEKPSDYFKEMATCSFWDEIAREG